MIIVWRTEIHSCLWMAFYFCGIFGCQMQCVVHKIFSKLISKIFLLLFALLFFDILVFVLLHGCAFFHARLFLLSCRGRVFSPLTCMPCLTLQRYTSRVAAGLFGLSCCMQFSYGRMLLCARLPIRMMWYSFLPGAFLWHLSGALRMPVVYDILSLV